MKIVYTNLIYFALLIYGLVGAAIDRLNSSIWHNMPDVKLKYDLIWGVIALWVAVTLVGMILRKKWAYQSAIAVNASFTLLPITIFIASTIMLWQEINLVDSITNYSIHLSIGIISCTFWLSLMLSKRVKNAYNKSSKSIPKDVAI